MKNRRAGFTLVELMITVALIGVLGLAFTPGLLAFVPKARADRAARGLAGEVQLARMRAVSTNRLHHVIFDSAGGTVTIQEEVNNGRATVKTISLASEYPSVSLDFNSVTAPDGSGAVNRAIAFGTGASTEVVFLPSGLARASGFFYVLPTADKDKRNERMRAVQVTLPGQVVQYRYKAGATPPWEEF